MKTLVLAAGASLILAAAASRARHPESRERSRRQLQPVRPARPDRGRRPHREGERPAPGGARGVGFQPKEGWTRTQNGRVVTWSGGQIGLDEFDEFGLSFHVPNTPGETLTFPATQTYANGKVVRWIGAPESDEPAPTLTIEAAESESPTPTTTTEARGDRERGRRRHERHLALGFGIAGLAVGLLALGLILFRKRGGLR